MRRVVRLGHPSRVDESLLEYCFDNQLRNTDSSRLVEDVQKEIQTAKLTLFGKKHKEVGKRNYEAVANLRHLRKELKQREKKAAFEVFDRCDAIFCTCVGADDFLLRKYVQERGVFDLTVIDEAGQCLEVSAWIPMLLSTRVVLAGDHQQLPPTVKSKSEGLQLTLFERLMKLQCETAKALPLDVVGSSSSVQLQRQYRMHRYIMHWSNATFYGNTLVADESVSDRTLSDEVASVLWVDTCGLPGYHEEEQVVDKGAVHGLSRCNEMEALVVVRYICRLVLEMGVPCRDICVISPYNKQVRTIRDKLQTQQLDQRYLSWANWPDSVDLRTITVCSVDGFQGRESDVVIVSLVRSNPQAEVGFLCESRRLNVALTRAKRHLVIVADSGTLRDSGNADLKSLVELLVDQTTICEITSALEVLQDVDEQPPAPANREVAVVEDVRAVEIFMNRLKKGQSDVPRGLRGVCKKLDEDLYEFTVNSYERMLVHSLCEKFGWWHQSVGEEKERRILVQAKWLTKKEPAKTASSTSQVEDSIEHGSGEVVRSDSSESEAEVAVGHTDEVSLDAVEDSETNVASVLNDVELSQVGKEQGISSITVRQNAKKNKSKGKSQRRKGAGETKPVPKLDLEGDDDMEILERVIANQWTCNFQGCSDRTKLLGRQCPFCPFRYCLRHALPEIHGCGDEASDKAKEDFRDKCRRQHFYTGVGANSTAKKNTLRRDLSSAIRSQQDARKPKQKKDDT
eukprot:GHVS01035565.1.p2 GENE.GHVS01035565.1~~GHVS01035565.1.p2  ORF type:complete len:740 (-),score=123.17 GHVS01035565.1:3464-5683(-)